MISFSIKSSIFNDYWYKLTEIVDKPNGTSEVRHYLDDFAIRTKSSSSEEIVYLHRDHIGSIVAKTTQQLSSSSHIKYQANEPWGRRQNTHWDGSIYNELTGSLLTQNTYATTRGFTDHEHLDGVGLIHMNGRVYDPIVGRFVSPDPWIQDPKNSQSFNRYSYVWNNPLRYTDPSGEIIRFFTSFGKIGHKLYQKNNKTGKLDKDSVGETLKEEGMDMLDDAMTLFDSDASILDKSAAGVDLLLGTEFNNKKVNTKKIDGLNNQVKNKADNSLTKLDEKKPDGVIKQGGRYGDLVTDGAHRHHMPSRQASPLSKADGPAIRMSPEDHRKTASYGGRKGSGQQAYRDKQADLIKQGKFDDAFMMDVDDIQSKFGNKYDNAILEAMDELP